jgi:mevalonate kinase
MNMNHGALVSLGLSTRELDAACHTARDTGAQGAKLTGAGGGGCVVPGARPGVAGAICEAWSAEGFESFRVHLGRDD